MGLESGAKSGFSALKAHWLFFLIVIVVAYALITKYDTQQRVRGFLVGLPLVGRFFA
jgi:type II secretory pathway component PulF